MPQIIRKLDINNFKDDTLKQYDTAAVLQNKNLANMFRFHNTFKKPSDKGRIHLMFRNIIQNRSYEKDLSLHYLEQENSRVLNVKKLDYRLRSKFSNNRFS